MSSGDPHGPDSNNNPYNPSVSASGFVGREDGIRLPQGQTRGMVGQSVILGVLMIVQGVLDCIAGVIAAFYAFFMPAMIEEIEKQAQQQGGQAPPPMPANFGEMFAIVGGLASFALLAIGLMLVVGGVWVIQFKGRVFAITALCLGLLTIATCYCFPTSLLLGIYGLIYLLNQPVSLAFTLRNQGFSAKQIQQAFMNLP